MWEDVKESVDSKRLKKHIKFLRHGQDEHTVGQAAHLNDNTIKRCKETITIKVRVALTFGGTEENVIGTGFVEGTFGVAGRVVFLDLSDGYESLPYNNSLKCAFVSCGVLVFVFYFTRTIFKNLLRRSGCVNQLDG